MIKRLTLDEFNKFLNQKMNENEIEIFYIANHINPLKVELFHDFIISLLDTIHDTYPGDDIYYEQYYNDHFKYCFEKVVNNFKKEQLFFDGDKTEIYDYFFFMLEETYYKDNEKTKTINALKDIYNRLFDMENTNKTKFDLEIFLDIYKSFLKFFVKNEA